MKYWTWTRELVTNHTGVVIATAVGFAVGAGGFAAAQRAEPAVEAPRAAVVASPDTTDATSTSLPATSAPTTDATTTSTVESPSTTVDDTANTTPSTVDDTANTTPNTVDDNDDATSTTIDDTANTTPNTVDDDDDATSTTIDDDDDATSTTIDDDDDTTSTTIDDDDDTTSTTIDDDDDTTSTTIDDNDDRATLAPFSQTYTSSGGSVTVTWTGVQLVIDAISPNAGFEAEIKDQSHDRIRVDFDHDELDDAGVEVRVDDGVLRVEID